MDRQELTPQRLLALEADAKDRLALLLDFTKEIATLGRRDVEPVTELRASSSSSRLVLHESSLRELQALHSADGHPAITLAGNGLTHATSSAGVVPTTGIGGGDSSGAAAAGGALRPAIVSRLNRGPLPDSGVWMTLRRPDPEASLSASHSEKATLARAANAMCAGAPHSTPPPRPW
jgi:hypothetical protein